MATTPIVSQVDYIKDVRRNRETRDWDAYVTIVATGETIYIGSAERSWDAERLCDGYVYNQLAYRPQAMPEPEPVLTPMLNDLEDATESREPFCGGDGAYWWCTHTPIAKLSNGETIHGTYDTDGSPSCAYYAAGPGHFYATSRDISGEWAGIQFEVLTPTQVQELRALFTGNTLPLLLEIAEAWTGEDQACAIDMDLPTIASVHIMGLLSTALEGRYTQDQISDIFILVAEQINKDLGILNYAELPVLERVRQRQEVGLPAFPIKAASRKVA